MGRVAFHGSFRVWSGRLSSARVALGWVVSGGVGGGWDRAGSGRTRSGDQTREAFKVSTSYPTRPVGLLKPPDLTRGLSHYP